MASRILVTGATGLVGTYSLVELREGSDDVIAAREAVPSVDLLAGGSVLKLLNAVRPDAVIHLAWGASGTPNYRTHSDNARWADVTVELADACIKRSIWFVGTGSIAELDVNPPDAYGRAKAEVWLHLRPIVDAQIITWLRPHYVFDPLLERPEVMAVIKAAVRHQQLPPLTHPHATHDFVHVKDVGAGVACVVRNRVRGVVPIGSGRLHTVAELARSAGATSVGMVEAKVDGSGTADTSKLLDLGWSPRWTKEFFSD